MSSVSWLFLLGDFFFWKSYNSDLGNPSCVSASFSDIIHKFTRDKYSKRFPELESLVPDSLDYIRTVKVREVDLVSHYQICGNL